MIASRLSRTPQRRAGPPAHVRPVNREAPLWLLAALLPLTLLGGWLSQFVR